jgi:hypothetical protein
LIYSRKALLLKGVEPTAVLYGSDERSFIQPAVFPFEKVEDGLDSFLGVMVEWGKAYQQ